jgi:ABC-2 type transport system ATP-binding protein
VLTVSDLHKAYGATVALAGVDLEVAPGEIVGLLGPNGAGKTSLVSIVSGLRRADRGTVLVGGIDVARAPDRAQRLLGLAPQETGVYLPLTVRDNLRFFAGLAGLRRNELRRRVDEVADTLGLAPLMDRTASELSGGERRRLHTAMALVHRPRLVLLDEPTTGADVRTRAEILGLVRRLAADGSAVVYSTHYLHEVEELDATVAVIDHGRIVARGSVADLVRASGSSALELRFEGTVPDAARPPGAVIDGTTVRVPADDPAGVAAGILARLGDDATALRSLEVLHPSLESVFLSVTGRRFDGDGQDPT